MLSKKHMDDVNITLLILLHQGVNVGLHLATILRMSAASIHDRLHYLEEEALLDINTDVNRNRYVLSRNGVIVVKKTMIEARINFLRVKQHELSDE